MTVQPALAPPSWWATVGESRAGLEWAGALVLPKKWVPASPGDGHAVVVVPGLLTGDAATWPLRRRLADWGYAARPWEQGLNRGPRGGVVAALVSRVRAEADRTGRPVSLIGWSLGGALAYAAAGQLGETVRHLITLGAPLKADAAISRASPIFKAVSGMDPNGAEARRRLAIHPPQSFTAVVSRHDGVVAGRAGCAPVGPARQTVWVPSTHLGMPANPCVQFVLGDRLAQPPAGADWKPFDVSAAPWWLRAAWSLA